MTIQMEKECRSSGQITFSRPALRLGTVGYSNVREDDNILLHNFRNDLHIT